MNIPALITYAEQAGVKKLIEPVIKAILS